MWAAKTDPQLSSSMQWALFKGFETRNKAKEQTNSTSYQATSGHFFWKSLYTYKKLRNKVVPYVESSLRFGDSNCPPVNVCIPTYVGCVTWSHTWNAVSHKIVGEAMILDIKYKKTNIVAKDVVGLLLGEIVITKKHTFSQKMWLVY